MTASGLHPSEWQAVADAVARTWGLHFPAGRAADLQRALGAAAVDLGLAPVLLARRLLAASLSEADGQLLVRHLTVGETYFFRDSALMDALSSHILADLIQARRGGPRRLRIWSAGCSSGEEPYSLAMLLHRLLPDPAEWDVVIEATDIDGAALRKGESGVYGEWSFRETPDSARAAFFEPCGTGAWRVREPIGRWVKFGSANLVQDAFPSGMDLVLCRNVLMYFTATQMAAVAQKLHASLADGGWLAVSPAEASQACFAQFNTVNFPGAVLYRKGGAQDEAAEAGTVAPAIPQAGPADAPAEPPLSARARALANQGRLQEALAVCDEWIGACKLDASAHYLRALVLIELGDDRRAGEALRSTVFLAPDFAMAHHALGALAHRLGQQEKAARHFAHAGALLRRHRPGDLLPSGDGLDVATLEQMLSDVTGPMAVLR